MRGISRALCGGQEAQKFCRVPTLVFRVVKGPNRHTDGLREIWIARETERFSQFFEPLRYCANFLQNPLDRSAKLCNAEAMMLREQAKRENIRGRNRRTKYPGICEFSARMGVSRVHVYYVLRGDRRSPRIERAWKEWRQDAR